MAVCHRARRSGQVWHVRKRGTSRRPLVVFFFFSRRFYCSCPVRMYLSCNQELLELPEQLGLATCAFVPRPCRAAPKRTYVLSYVEFLRPGNCRCSFNFSRMAWFALWPPGECDPSRYKFRAQEHRLQVRPLDLAGPHTQTPL